MHLKKLKVEEWGYSGPSPLALGDIGSANLVFISGVLNPKTKNKGTKTKNSQRWWQCWEFSCELVSVCPAAVVAMCPMIMALLLKTWSWLFSHQPTLPWFKSQIQVQFYSFPMDAASYLISIKLSSFLLI